MALSDALPSPPATSSTGSFPSTSFSSLLVPIPPLTAPLGHLPDLRAPHLPPSQWQVRPQDSFRGYANRAPTSHSGLQMFPAPPPPPPTPGSQVPDALYSLYLLASSRLLSTYSAQAPREAPYVDYLGVIVAFIPHYEDLQLTGEGTEAQSSSFTCSRSHSKWQSPDLTLQSSSRSHTLDHLRTLPDLCTSQPSLQECPP